MSYYNSLAAKSLLDSYRPLPWEQQLELFAVRGTDAWPESRGRLFACYTALVVKETNYFVRRQTLMPASTIFEDILSEMCLKLLRSLETFVPGKKDAKFPAYFCKGTMKTGYVYVSRFFCPMKTSPTPNLFMKYIEQIGPGVEIDPEITRSDRDRIERDVDSSEFTQHMLDFAEKTIAPVKRYALGRRMQGALNKEIQEEVGMTIGATQHLSTHAMRMLLKEFGDEMSDSYVYYVDPHMLAVGLVEGSEYTPESTRG